MDKKRLKIRLVLWLALAAAVVFFGYMKIVPSGQISYAIGAGNSDYFIGRLSPADRVQTKDGQAVIKGEPVYFSLRPPRRFETAKVSITFKNTTDYPVAELGLLTDKTSWNYDLKPLENKVIDRLALVWPSVTGPGSTRLIEREKKFDSVSEFLGNLPPKNEIALYDYDLKSEYKLTGYEPSGGLVLDYGFRGSYQFYTYLHNEDLSYNFTFADLNFSKEDDPVTAKVYGPEGLVYEKRLEDDGRQERGISFKLPGLKEGVYRVAVIAGDDIITKKIITSQSRFAFINKIWLAENSATRPVLYTDSREVSAQTINPASLGRVKAGSGEISLSETYKQFSAKTGERPAKVEADKSDVIISGDGVFSFSQDSLINPNLSRADRNLDVNGENINYVITDYRTPVSADGLVTATADFDLTKAYLENGKYQFMISFPGLKADDKAAGQAVIKQIKIDLRGTSLLDKLKKLLKRL